MAFSIWRLEDCFDLVSLMSFQREPSILCSPREVRDELLDIVGSHQGSKDVHIMLSFCGNGPGPLLLLSYSAYRSCQSHELQQYEAS